MTDIIEALKKGAGITTAAMNAAADRKRREEEQKAENLAVCRTTGKPLIDFGELITSMEADEDGTSFAGCFETVGDRLRGDFAFGTKEERGSFRLRESRETTKEISIIIKHDDGFTVFAGDLPNNEGTRLNEKETGVALEDFAEWAGRVAPEWVPKIEAALRREDDPAVPELNL